MLGVVHHEPPPEHWDIRPANSQAVKIVIACFMRNFSIKMIRVRFWR
jgi:hypothetical protein